MGDEFNCIVLEYLASAGTLQRIEFSLQATVSASVTLSICPLGDPAATAAASCCQTAVMAYAVVAILTKFELVGGDLGTCHGLSLDAMTMVKSRQP